MMNSALVSIIIPCFNQAHFLAEAVESALAQTYPDCEVIVVDDGSTDNTCEVAGRYPTVRLVRQENRGLAEARNTGLRHSRGSCLVFLDADDRLLPEAVAQGLEAIYSRPECAFVFGRHRLIDREGRPLATRPAARRPPGAVGSYAWLLQGNLIGMHATVLYRRSVFEAVGGFNNRLPAAEDYDLYLRVARRSLIAFHDHLVAEYRRHDANMSCNIPVMLDAVLTVLHSQLPHVRGNPLYERMYRRGVQNWVTYYLKRMARAAWSDARAGDARVAIKNTVRPLRSALQRACRSVRGVFSAARWRLRTNWRLLVRRLTRPVEFGDLRRVTPFGRGPAHEPGPVIQQHFLESFLAGWMEEIQGDVLEVGDGSSWFSRSAARVIIKEDPEFRTDQLPDGPFDCILLLDSLRLVYDLRQAVQALYRRLKPGGVLLAALSGFPPPGSTGRGYWLFTRSSAMRLFSEVFPPAEVQVQTCGNVLAAAALLHGLPAEVLDADELKAPDPQFPIMISVRAVRPGGWSGADVH